MKQTIAVGDLPALDWVNFLLADAKDGRAGSLVKVLVIPWRAGRTACIKVRPDPLGLMFPSVAGGAFPDGLAVHALLQKFEGSLENVKPLPWGLPCNGPS